MCINHAPMPVYHWIPVRANRLLSSENDEVFAIVIPPLAQGGPGTQTESRSGRLGGC